MISANSFSSGSVPTHAPGFLCHCSLSSRVARTHKRRELTNVKKDIMPPLTTYLRYVVAKGFLDGALYHQDKRIYGGYRLIRSRNDVFRQGVETAKFKHSQRLAQF